MRVLVGSSMLKDLLSEVLVSRILVPKDWCESIGVRVVGVGVSGPFTVRIGLLRVSTRYVVSSSELFRINNGFVLVNRIKRSGILLGLEPQQYVQRSRETILFPKNYLKRNV